MRIAIGQCSSIRPVVAAGGVGGGRAGAWGGVRAAAPVGGGGGGGSALPGGGGGRGGAVARGPGPGGRLTPPRWVPTATTNPTNTTTPRAIETFGLMVG